MLHRFGVALALFALAAGSGWLSAQEPLALGAAAPKTEVKMKNIDGRELSIADAAGEKGTLVMFSCNACPWVKAWEDRIAALGNRYQKKGVGVIVINPNDPEVQAEDSYAVMQERAKQRGFEFPYVVDATSDVARAFGATRTPEAFLFDAAGKLIYHGAIDDNAKQPDQVEEPYLKNALEALIGGQAIAVRETKSIGCTIKFRT
ncbi:MAG TPA: thioredoxin family protein [Acidobacteriota bacterium]